MERIAIVSTYCRQAFGGKVLIIRNVRLVGKFLSFSPIFPHTVMGILCPQSMTGRKVNTPDGHKHFPILPKQQNYWQFNASPHIIRCNSDGPPLCCNKVALLHSPWAHLWHTERHLCICKNETYGLTVSMKDFTSSTLRTYLTWYSNIIFTHKGTFYLIINVKNFKTWQHNNLLHFLRCTPRSLTLSGMPASSTASNVLRMRVIVKKKGGGYQRKHFDFTYWYSAIVLHCDQKVLAKLMQKSKIWVKIE